MDTEDSVITINTTSSTTGDADRVRMMHDLRRGRINPTEKLKVGFRTVRSCKADSTQMLLVNEMKKHGLNIGYFSESRLNDILRKSIDLTDSKTFKFYNSGPTVGSGLRRPGFLLDPIAALSVIS